MNKSKITEALLSGAILAVDWKNVQEILGTAPDQVLHCAIYENTGNFIPVERFSFDATEKEIDDILKETRPAWMTEDYPSDLGILGHTQTRLFAVKEPNPVRWLNNSPV